MIPLKNFSRREALKLLGSGALLVTLPSLWSCKHRVLDTPSVEDTFATISPLDRNYVHPPQNYSGDNPDRAHAILWDKEGYLQRLGALPPVTEEAEVVVIGGGMSGLITSYLLRDLKPILLERAERFGGNSRGESWAGAKLEYSIGAAYFMSAEPGTPIHSLFKEVGIYDFAKVKKEDDPILYRGKLYQKFLEGGTDPQAVAQFRRFEKFFADFGQSKNGRVYPVIPPTNERERKSVRELDRWNFLAYVEKELGEALHPHLRALLEDYCWSGMGSTMQDTSAALGIYFFAGEFADVMVAPGGNARIAEQLLRALHREMPENLRPSSVVLDVETHANFSYVTYEDSMGKARRIKARAVVMACPKFVAKKIIRDLEPNRLRAFANLRYQAYLVANALLRSPVRHPGYDIFLIGEGKPLSTNLREAAHARGATDVVSATYASGENTAALTLYRPLPYPEGRAELFDPASFERFEKEFRTQLEKEILPGLGYAANDLAELRLTRWGHPIPVATPGIFRNGTLDRLQRPFRDRVFFVQQDNWACPALETCAREALRWAPKIRELLQRRT